MLLRVFLSLVAAVSVALVLVPSRDAHAQAVAIAQPMPRLDRNGAQVTKRAVDLQPEAINRQDCLDEQRIGVPVVLSGFEANGRLEAWASSTGADCAPPSSRMGAAPACSRVTESLPLMATQFVGVPVRKLLAVAAPPGETRACSAVDATVSLQLLYFAASNPSTPVATSSVSVRVDTIGGPTLEGITTAPGDRRAAVRWTSPAGALPAPRTNLYCSASTCATDPFPRTPIDADFDARFLCATLAGGGDSLVATMTADGASLVNGASYAVAVASVDELGNVGEPSATACVVPSADAAEESSGESGSCSASAARRPGGPALLLLVGFASAGMLARRGRNGSRRRRSAT